MRAFLATNTRGFILVHAHNMWQHVYKMVTRKRSPIWQFFVEYEDTRFASCKDCSENVSRGGKTTKTYITSNLVIHLKKHSLLYSDYLEKKWFDEEFEMTAAGPSGAGTSKQVTLITVLDRGI